MIMTVDDGRKINSIMLKRFRQQTLIIRGQLLAARIGLHLGRALSKIDQRVVSQCLRKSPQAHYKIFLDDWK